MSTLAVPEEPARLARDSSVAPDAIEPIVAYRAWRYEPADTRAPLHPMARRPGETWIPDEWTQARCLAGGLTSYVTRAADLPPHVAPLEGCTCGLYAMKSLEDLVLELSDICSVRQLASARVLIGKVELAGKVIEHDLGYRAERGRLVELYSAPGVLEVPFAAAAAYGVPVTDELGAALRRPGVSAPRPSNARPHWTSRVARTLSRSGSVFAGLLALALGVSILASHGHSSTSGLVGVAQLALFGAWSFARTSRSYRISRTSRALRRAARSGLRPRSRSSPLGIRFNCGGPIG